MSLYLTLKYTVSGRGFVSVTAIYIEIAFVSFIAIISYAGVTLICVTDIIIYTGAYIYNTHKNMQVLYKYTVMLINCFVSFTGC